MNNLTKISVIGVVALLTVYGVSVLDKNVPLSNAEPAPLNKKQIDNSQINAPASIKPNVKLSSPKAPQPAKTSSKTAEHSIAKHSLHQQKNAISKSRPELAQNDRLAPPPPLAPGETTSSRHNTFKNERSHGHEHPVKATTNNQPAPPKGANI